MATALVGASQPLRYLCCFLYGANSVSFWFAKQARKRPKGAAGAPKKAPATPVAQGAAILNRLGCKGCPLNKDAAVCTPKMSPTLARQTDVYFLAEAPGAHEDEQSGKPLTGPPGKLLRSVLVDCHSASNSYDNVINCRPPGNRTPTGVEIECCRPRRIAYIEEAKPKLIVGLGVVPMQMMLGTSDITGLRGRLFAVKVGSHKCWFLPTYDPLFILRAAFDKQRPLNSRFGHCFKMDIKRAMEIVGTLEPPEIVPEASLRDAISVFSGAQSTDYQQTMKTLDRAIEAPVKAIDLETRFLRPHMAGAAIMSAAISFGETHFAFAIDHPKNGWTGPQREAILNKLKRLLKDDTLKIAHHAPFEIEWLIALFGPKIVNHTAWACTMMMAHFLDERKGKYRDDDSKASRYQGLDFLIHQHFGLKFKHLFKLNKKDMAQSDLGETLIYNAVDTKLTLKLYRRLSKLLKADGTLDAYNESALRQPTVALMQYFGIPVDHKAVKAAQKKLEPKIKTLESKINSLKVVKAFTTERHKFNWQSGPDCIAIFKDYLKCGEIKVAGKAGAADRYSVDKNVLDQIDHPLAKLLVQARELAKLKSTYIDSMELGGEKVIIYPDGSLHTSFNTTATETGRLSSDGPNLQNYPKRKNAWVRSLVVPPKGHVLVAIDYGQLEACTGAMCSRDKYLVKALWEDYDIHMEWAQKFARVAPELVQGDVNDKDAMKKFRALIKNKMVFPAFFGAANDSVRGYLHAATGFDVEQEIVDDKMDEFWSTFNGMARWQKETMKRYYAEGYVKTLQGRKHRYPLTKNQAVNMPIQGTAAELVCDAMNRLSYMALRTGKLHLHPILNIHDDLTFIIPDNDAVLEESIQIIIREMLIFDFKWVNVPMSVEVSIGPNWSDVSPIGKFWSHKEFNFPRR